MFTGWQRLVRFGFHLLYNQMAWTYDVVSWLVSLGEWRHWQRAALPYLASNTKQLDVEAARFILEIGHGPGHLLLELAAAGKQVVGLDLSSNMGRMAQNRLQRAGHQAQLIQGNVQELPFPEGSFDAVLSTFPTDFIVDPATLAAVHRALGENGRFVIIPAAHLTGKGIIHRLIDSLFRLTGQQKEGVEMETACPRVDMGAVWQPLQQRFAHAGFETSIKQIQRPRSSITLIVAQKR